MLYVSKRVYMSICLVCDKVYFLHQCEFYHLPKGSQSLWPRAFTNHKACCEITFYWKHLLRVKTWNIGNRCSKKVKKGMCCIWSVQKLLSALNTQTTKKNLHELLCALRSRVLIFVQKCVAYKVCLTDHDYQIIYLCLQNFNQTFSSVFQK